MPHDAGHAPPHHDSLPVTPSLAPLMASANIGGAPGGLERRTVRIGLLAIAVGLVAALLAQALVGLIGLISHLAFEGRWVWGPANPADNHLGVLVIAVPVIGALIVGVMARLGSPAIRGHGIPEAM